jgi:ligand-binding SRPBCC domain-containing protein
VWIHEHTFTESKGGCGVQDFVRYSAPGGWPVDRLFVRHEERRIVEYRAPKLPELFV